jgi:hypothetical protein
MGKPGGRGEVQRRDVVSARRAAWDLVAAVYDCS